MAKKQKVYAVKKGHKTGIFYSWDDCKAATSGFPSPEYKSFESEEEAAAFLSDKDIVFENQIAPLLYEGKLVAFVDGSFNEEKQTYGYGVYILTPNSTSPVELSGKNSNQEYVDLRNVTGEILGAINAIDWAWKNGYNSIVIFHDYEGISKWALGEWKTNQTITKFYKKFIDEKKDIISIDFVKVSGHSNNKYNDRVDALAKASVNENKVLKDSNGSGGYIINTFSNDTVFTILEQLKNDCQDLRYDIEKQTNKTIYIVTLKKDRVTLSVYNNIRLLVQGKKNNLFQLITTQIIERLDNVEFIKVLRDVYEKNIKQNELNVALHQYCPKLKEANLPQNIEKLLNQAIVDLGAYGYNDIEFSKYTLAALRALEGVLKFNLSHYSINVNRTFGMFEKKNGVVYSLNNDIINTHGISSVDSAKIETCYNYYYNNRHTLCHFGLVLNGIDTNTRVLSTKQEANAIIIDTFKVINDNYIL